MVEEKCSQLSTTLALFGCSALSRTPATLGARDYFHLVPLRTRFMRELTPTEQETLQKRRQGFDGFVHEVTPILVDFADRLGLENPNTIADKPDDFLDPIDDFMKGQIIEEEDRVWTITRLGYFIGQVLIQRLGGEWLLNEHPGSR